MTAVVERVASGAAWLDENYPNWWKSIDLGTLQVSSCLHCVLGQVYTGHVPTHEQDQILTQVVEAMAARVSKFEARSFAESVHRGVSGGFNVLYEKYQLKDSSAALGFSIDYEEKHWRSTTDQFAALTDEWTKVIISRRLAEARSDSAELVSA